MSASGEIGSDVLGRLGLKQIEQDSSEPGAMRSRIDETEKRAIDEALRRNRAT